MRNSSLAVGVVAMLVMAMTLAVAAAPLAGEERQTLASVGPALPPADPSAYPFVADEWRPTISLRDRFGVPDGFHRVPVEPGSFGAWLRVLPLRTDSEAVHAYDGRKISAPAAAVAALGVGERNLQQCADSVIRLHAEWLRASGRSRELAYHFTSGDRVTFDDWRAGERLRISGSSVKRSRGPARSSDRGSFHQWLELVFMYAGTRSLHRDANPVTPGDVRPGDFFVAPGSPGHAVIVLDVAIDEAGHRVALLGQGFMPAQDFHVLKSSRATIAAVWFPLPEKPDDRMKTPSWEAFTGRQAFRFVAQ